MSQRPTSTVSPNLPSHNTTAIFSGPADAPAFAEPWQAEAFATAVVLSRSGVFTWKEWTETFGDEIKRHPQRADEDANAAYYRQWLSALEGILSSRGLAHPSEVSDTMEHWRRSYLNTPHGSPVALRRDWHSVPSDALTDDEHDHHHDADDEHPSPIAVSSALGSRAR